MNIIVNYFKASKKPFVIIANTKYQENTQNKYT